jgi:hypothetical protein
MNGEYYIDLFDDDQMISVFPHCEKYSKIFGRIGAKWEKEEKGWIFPNKYEGFVKKVIKRVVKEDQNEGASSLISANTSSKHRSRSDDDESSDNSEEENVNKKIATRRKSPSRKSPSRKSPSRKTRPRRSHSHRPRNDSSESEAAGETNNEENVDINQMILEKLEIMEKRIRKLEEH